MRRYHEWKFQMQEKHLRVAWLLLECLHRPNFSQKDALVAAGYSPKTARVPSQVIKRTRGIREFIRVLADLRGIDLKLPPARKKYGRKYAVEHIKNYCDPRLPGMNNAEVEHAYKGQKYAERIARGEQYQAPKVCTCGTRLDDYGWCLQCSRYPYGRNKPKH